MKIKKAFNSKIVSILVVVVFLLQTTAYSIELPRKSHLRVPLSGGNKRLQEGMKRVQSSHDILPEDLVEIPRRRFRLKPERELTERQAEQRASIEIQKDIAIIIAELSVIVADYRATEGAEIQEEISQRENLLLERLRSLYRNMPVAIHSDKDYDFYSTTLKELKKRRNEIYDRIEEADAEGNKKALQKLNLEAIRNTRTLTKLQVLIAGMLLAGKSKLKSAELKRNAALWTLQGALNSAKMLEDELYYRTQRLRGKQKIQEIETTDWMGQLVRSFRLGALDIMVKDIEEGEEKPRVTIRQQRWLNVNTRLISIRRDLKRGEVGKAIRKIDSLIRIYGLRYIITLESYKGITADLKAIREMALGLPESHAPPREEIDRTVDKINNLAQRITHPKQLIWTDVEYKSLGSALRGKIESIAGYIPDYTLVMASKTDLEYYAEKLKIAKETGHLSKRNRDIIERGITKLASWTRRGFVDPKQFADIDLKPVIDLMESDDFRTAEAYCRNAAQDLGARLSDIDSIVLHEKKKANDLYIAYRDKDITERIAEISSSIESGDFESALSQVIDLQELYFNQKLVEPGYIRAERLSRELVRSVRAVDSVEDQDLAIRNISSILSDIKKDIAHKGSFKITVTREDGKSRKFFINPGTTALGVLNLRNLKRDPKKTLVSIGRGWIPQSELKKVKLGDGAHVILEPKKDVKSARATGGEGYRKKDPDTEDTGLASGHNLYQYINNNIALLDDEWEALEVVKSLKTNPSTASIFESRGYSSMMAVLAVAGELQKEKLQQAGWLGGAADYFFKRKRIMLGLFTEAYNRLNPQQKKALFKDLENWDYKSRPVFVNFRGIKALIRFLLRPEYEESFPYLRDIGKPVSEQRFLAERTRKEYLIVALAIIGWDFKNIVEGDRDSNMLPRNLELQDNLRRGL